MIAGTLRCEYQQNPLCIDAEYPRLSWTLSSPERNKRQTAYQILVASSVELLAADKGDLWDSGRVESAQSAQVEYAGLPMQSFRRQLFSGR
jgi:alpha-L-rhamnosidase